MITGINHINFAVTDINRSFDFYYNILQLKPLCRWPEGAYFLAGNDWVCLFQDSQRESKTAPCYTHLAFSISQENFPHLVKRILDAGVSQWKDNKSEGESLYFLDPDGHKLEIHVGNWQTRMVYKTMHPWKNTHFFKSFR